MSQITVGQWLRRRRRDAGLTLKELSARIPYDAGKISDCERGKRKIKSNLVMPWKRALEMTEADYQEFLSLYVQSLSDSERRKLPPAILERLVPTRHAGPSAKTSSETPSVEASHAEQSALMSLHQLPAPPRDFTGREVEFAELLDAEERGGVTISGLRGMGGIGKTALGLKLAEQLTPRYPDAQFYLDLRGTSKQPLSVADALAHVIRSYRPNTELPKSEDELRGLYQSVLYDQRVLLLMDNAANAQQVEPLIPAAGSFLLVTTRQHFALPGLLAKNLNTLPPNDAQAFLLKIAPRIGDRADAIAELCGYLPLALRLAGSALAEQVDLSPTDYERRLIAAKTRLNLVDSSLSLSYELLNSEMQKRWCALAVFPETFDISAAAAVWELDPATTQDSLSDLLKYSLAEWNKATARYRLHDLARLVADARLSKTQRRATQRRHAAYYESLLRTAKDLYEKGGSSMNNGLDLFDKEWNNIRAGQAWAAANFKKDDVATRLCSTYPDRGAYLLFLRQHPQDRIRWLEAALAATRHLEQPRLEVSHLGNLGLAYNMLGEFRRAIEFYEQALVIAREIGERRFEGYALGNLGEVHLDLGEFRRSIEFSELHLTIAREIGDRRGEGNALGNIGIAYTKLGEPHRAIQFYEKQLQITRDIGDPVGESHALKGLGLANANLTEFDRAIESYELALAIAREIGDQQNAADILGNMGHAREALGEVHDAIDLYEQQLVTARGTGDRHGEGRALWNKSLALNKLGGRVHAIQGAEAALRIFEHIEYPAVTEIQRQLTQWKQGQE